MIILSDPLTVKLLLSTPLNKMVKWFLQSPKFLKPILLHLHSFVKVASLLLRQSGAEYK